MTNLFSWYDGTLPTVVGSGVTLDASTGSPVAGSLAIAATGSQTYAQFTVASPTVCAARWHFRTPAAWPSASIIMASWMNAAVIASMQLASSAAPGAVRLLRQGGAQVATSANNVLALNTWYRAELHDDTTGTRARVAVFAIGNNTPIYDSGWQTHANFANLPTRFSVGCLSNQTFTYKVDSILGVDSAAAFIGEAPSDTPPQGLASVTRHYSHPGQTLILSAAGSTDDHGIIAYHWDQLTGATVTINNANTATANFTAPATLGDLTFRLTVTDTIGQTDSVDLTVTVAPFGTVTIVGDSLTERLVEHAAPPSREAATRAMLHGAGWDPIDVYWYGKGGKRMLAADANGRTTINDLTAAATALGGELTQVVIALSTNDILLSDTDFGNAIDDILDAAEALDVVDLLWVNIALKNPANILVNNLNPIIAAKVGARSFARVANWRDYIHGPTDLDDWLPDEDVHLSTQGNAKRDQFILRELGGPGGEIVVPDTGVSVWNGATEDVATVTVWNGTTEDPADSIDISP